MTRKSFQLIGKMKGIQLQLQMATERGVYNDDEIRHINQLKGEYSILLRELRKRRHANKRKRILQKFDLFGCRNSLKSKVIFISYNPIPTLLAYQQVICIPC